MTKSSIGLSDMQENGAYPLQVRSRKRSDWRDRLVQFMPPIFPTLMIALAVSAFLIEDYFLLEIISAGLCSVSGAIWLTKNRTKYPWIKNLFSKECERISWAVYSIIAAFSLITPAFATGTGGGNCTATNTLLGPIADAMIGVFNSSAQVGSTGEIGENICQVFVTFAAVIALLVIGTIIYGLFDNQGRGSDIGKAFTPLGLVLAGAVLTRISIKVVMGV